MVIAGIYAIINVGLNVHYGHTGLFNIGIAAFFARWRLHCRRYWLCHRRILSFISDTSGVGTLHSLWVPNESESICGFR